MDELAAGLKNEIFRALGEAVAKAWSSLPQDLQHRLFEEAVRSQDEAMRPRLAVFLHHQHPRTSDGIKAQAMLEPDSLGG
jgi:hypothetical protein